MDYGVFIVTKPGGRYKNFNPDKTHYDDPVDKSPGRPAGTSRRWGDASADVQKQVIDTIIELGRENGLSNHDLAYVLAMAWQESGFNPDAAAGTTTASGLGQFVDHVGSAYGLNAQNRFDITANADALIQFYLYNKRIAEQRGKGDAYIYKYHHDGPSAEHGGLLLAQKRVMPKVQVFEKALDAHDGTSGVLGRFLQPIEDLIHSIGALFGKARSQPAPKKDPIVFDLDGDGIETISADVGVYFDYDNNGFSERTGWVTSDDGFLVLDRDGDGEITHGAELFGDQTVLQTGAQATDGFAALREWDEVGNGGNADGKLSADDAVWAMLRIWQDADVNGYSDEEELHTLAELGIAQIGLSTVLTGRDDGDGNLEVQGATFSRADGAEGRLAELRFGREPSDTIWDPVEVPDDFLLLPDMEGSGNTRSLHEAMALDEAGALRETVETFVAEADSTRRSELVDEILFRWVGVEHIIPNSRGGAIDARKLLVLEVFLGESFVGAVGPNPVPDAAIILESAYHSLAERVYAELASQTTLKPLFDLVAYEWSDTTQSLIADYQAAATYIETELARAPDAGVALLKDFARAIRGFGVDGTAEYAQLRNLFVTRSEDLTIAFDSGGRNVILGAGTTNALHGTTGADLLVGGAGNDSITAYDGDDVIYGGEGDDVLSGCENDDQLYGGAGNDHLFGAEDNDVLDGGPGNDYLNGGTGNDVYVLALGTGQDQIADYDAAPGNIDAIRIDPSAAGLAVDFWRRGNDLYVGLEGADDTMQGRDWFSGTAYRVEEVILADGSRITTQQLAAARFLGSPQADVISGSTDGDYLEGLGGNDVLQGHGGDDVIDGGAGNDTLYGGSSGYFAAAGAGNDTYLFARGYGHDLIYDYDGTPGNTDTIRLKDLLAEEVTLRREGNDLFIDVNDSDDQIRVADWGVGADYRIERIEFGDGSVLEGAALVAPFLGTAGNDSLTGTTEDEVLLGLDGNDYLFGGGGNDVLDGGPGNDTLFGGAGGYTPSAGAGNDVYVFGRGDGQDTIYDYDTTAGNLDTIRLKDLLADEVTLRREGQALVIDVNDSSDEIRVADWGSGAASRIERVEFADGSVLEGDALVAPFLGTAGNDTLTGTAEDDVLMGLAGNDILVGGTGNDVLDGGIGNDTLYGGTSGYASTAGAGNDVYVFGRGYGQDTIYDYDTTPDNSDTVRLTDLNAADVTIKRVGNSFVLSVNGSTDELRIADWALGKNYRIERIQFADASVLEGEALVAPFLGTAGNDSLTGTADDDVLMGLAGNDVLLGGTGNDVLDGGTGNDTLYGGTSGYTPTAGAGNDTYVFGRGYGSDVIYDYDTTAGNLDTIKLKDLNAADVTIRRDSSTFYIAVNGAADQIRVGNWGSGAAYRIERVEFADGSILTGADLARVPYLGTAGGDSFTGTAEDEIMYGLGGNDNLVGAGGDDRLEGGDGTDTLNGGDGNDVLLGGDGIDTLYGGLGNDLLDGGAGADRMYGNAGDDVFRVDATGDLVYENANEGNDTVFASITYTLADKPNLENITLEGSADLNATGNAANNVLIGNDGANVLTGGAGNDTLDGGPGADRLDGGSGEDRLNFSPDDWWIAPWTPPDPSDQAAYQRWERLFQAFFRNRSLDTYAGGSGTDTLVGTGSGDGMVLDASYYDASAPTAASFVDIEVFVGGDGDDVIDLRSPTLVYGPATLDGGNGADFLWGNVGDDLLIGGDGYDVLDGGAGADRMIGGPGGDSYVVDSAGDVVIELVGEGTDSVTSSVTYTLPDNVERLVLAGNDPINGMGNDLSNTLTGNTAANVLWGGVGDDLLRGGGGADLLIGGAGDDTYYLESGEEQIQEAAGAGHDQVFGWFSQFLGPNLEDLYLVSPLTALVGVGNELDNRLFGNFANNLLEGGDGADRLDGDAGNDLLVGGRGDDSLDARSGADVVAVNAGDGRDSLLVGGTSVTVSLGGGIAYEDLALRRDGSDLVLETGAGDSVTLAEWYNSATAQPQHLWLQTIAEAMPGYDAGSADALLNKKVQQFDFKQLVQEYDQARAADPTLDRWALMNRLLDARLAASDTEAIGGDLAYQYGTAGSLAGIDPSAAQQVLNATQFGTQAQVLRPLSELQTGTVGLN